MSTRKLINFDRCNLALPSKVFDNTGPSLCGWSRRVQHELLDGTIERKVNQSMQNKPLFALALLTLLAAGCASDPTYNLLPPPIYQRGSLEGPTARQVASVESSPRIELGASYAPVVDGLFSR
jgi:hypothetical protein